LVIVEGPDGAGKTVLVGQLVKTFPRLKMAVDVWETKGEKDKHKEERRISTVRMRTYTAIGEAFRGTKPLIHDRLIYSELVYGQLLRGHIKFHPMEVEFMHMALVTLQCPVIMCLPPFSVVEHNVHNTEDHLDGVNEQIEAIYGGYLNYAADLSHSEANFLGYDYTRTGEYEDVVRRIEMYLDRRKVREP
jgi:thymidylate kinase